MRRESRSYSGAKIESYLKGSYLIESYLIESYLIESYLIEISAHLVVKKYIKAICDLTRMASDRRLLIK